MKKKYLEFVIVVFFSFVLELLVFNNDYIMNKFDNSIEYNKEYDLDDLITINWEKENNKFISKTDSNLILESLNTYVKSISLDYKLSDEIPEIVLFYTNENNSYFNADQMIIQSNPQSGNTIEVNKNIYDLRIDLSDMEGLVLHNIKIVVNPSKLNVSIYRMLAIFFIYYSFNILFALQKKPDYEI